MSESQVTVDPAAATASLLSALPNSIQAILATNPAQAISVIESEFFAPTPPSWFTGLPGAVQTYFITSALAGGATPVSISSAPTAQTTGTSKTSSSSGQSSPVSDSSSSPTTSILSSTSVSSDINSGSGLSAGAKAGIAIGVIVGVCFLLAVILLFIHQRRKTAKPQKRQLDYDETQAKGGSEAIDLAQEIVQPKMSAGSVEPKVQHQNMNHRIVQQNSDFQNDDGNYPKNISELPVSPAIRPRVITATAAELPQNTSAAPVELEVTELQEMPSDRSPILPNAEMAIGSASPTLEAERESEAYAESESVKSPILSTTQTVTGSQTASSTTEFSNTAGEINHIEEELLRIRTRQRRLQEMQKLEEEEAALTEKLSNLRNQA